MPKSIKIIIIGLLVIGLAVAGFFVSRRFVQPEMASQPTSRLALEKALDPVNGQMVGDKIPKTNPFDVKINPFDAYKNPFNQ